LCEALTQLSEALWDIYALPASAAADDDHERRRREQERGGFAGVLDAIANPRMSNGEGLLLVSYSPIAECAHIVGRTWWQSPTPP
jgi:hypothetical protein